MQEFLIKLSTDHIFFVYLFALIFASVEGPILSIIFGVLIKLGYFSFAPVYAILILGDMLGDTTWYGIGRYYGYSFVRKYGKFFSITPERIHKVEHIFHTYQKTILIISKLTAGFGFAIVTLFTAGLVKIPFKTFIALNFMGQFVWTAILIGFGYYFSHLYIVFDSVFARMGIFAGFIVLIFAFVGFAQFIKQKMSK